MTVENVDIHLIQTTLVNSNLTIDTEKLISLGILTHKRKHIIATNGGVILLGKLEILQTHFPFAEVRCARFVGNTRAEFIDRLNTEGVFCVLLMKFQNLSVAILRWQVNLVRLNIEISQSIRQMLFVRV